MVATSGEADDGTISSLLGLSVDGCCASIIVGPFFAILLSFFVSVMGVYYDMIPKDVLVRYVPYCLGLSVT